MFKGATSLSQYMKRSWISTALLVIGDLAALTLALIVAILLKYDSLSTPSVYQANIAGRHISLALSAVLYIFTFAQFRLYRYSWRFASLEVLWSVLAANSIGLFGLIVLQTVIDHSRMPATLMALFFFLSIVFVGSARVLLRLSNLHLHYGRHLWQTVKKDTMPRRVVILSSGPNAARIVRFLKDEQNSKYNIIGVLDDDTSSHNTYVHSIKVLGPLNKLNELLKDKSVDEVFIALPEASGGQIRQYVMACRQKKIKVKVIPALQDMLNGKTKPRVEDIRIEDLLRRPPAKVNLKEVGAYLTNRRVLVTGAGGSIGSELCRQICALHPSELVLLGHGENSIHQIYQELSRNFPEMKKFLYMVIGSVSDEKRMQQVFNEFRPDVVFHAAAHKHVPIMEKNILEAVQNNVIGTYRVAECCHIYGVKRMVLISSDKAVNPSCIMGATKSICENVVKTMAALYPETAYLSVRFGNVLGSRGSVVPIFKDQINRGGPVTITHPDMTRYFMSIPEAVLLVMQAGAIGRSGELFILDMGEPIRIMDLAQDMIRLSGLEPEVDIQVVCTGIRPGEKLHEELNKSDEIIETTECQDLFSVHRPKYCDTEAIFDEIRRMQHMLNKGDVSGIRALLSHIFPNFDDESDFVPDEQSYNTAARL